MEGGGKLVPYQAHALSQFQRLGTLITELQYWGQSVRVFGQRLMNEQELIDRLLDPVHDGQLIYL